MQGEREWWGSPVGPPPLPLNNQPPPPPPRPGVEPKPTATAPLRPGYGTHLALPSNPPPSPGQQNLWVLPYPGRNPPMLVGSPS